MSIGESPRARSRWIRLVGGVGELVLVGGDLRHATHHSTSMGQTGALVANSTGALQNQSYECGARTRALRVLRVHSAHTPSSPPSGGTNSMILFTVAAVQSTCGSRGSPHAVSMKGRQRRHRSDLSERPAGTAGRGVHAARAYHGSHLWYRDQTVPARVRGDSPHASVELAQRHLGEKARSSFLVPGIFCSLRSRAWAWDGGCHTGRLPRNAAAYRTNRVRSRLSC